jgi:hypothetical protein
LPAPELPIITRSTSFRSFILSMSTRTLQPATIEDVRWQVCAKKEFLKADEVKLTKANLVLGEWLFFVTPPGAVLLSFLLHQTVLQDRLLVSMRSLDFFTEVVRMGAADSVIEGRLPLTVSAFRRAVKDLEAGGYLFRKRMGCEWAVGLYFSEWREHYPL